MAAECESGAKDDADADDEAEDKDEAPTIEAIDASEVGKKAWRSAACSGDEGA